MGTVQSILKILSGLSELLALLRILAERAKEIDARSVAKHTAEVREAQRRLEADILRVKSDEERAVLARRLSQLERD